MSETTLVALIVTLGCWGCVAAANDPRTSPTTGGSPALSVDSSVEQVLDALDRRGRDLRTMTATVKLAERDAALGDKTSRSGRFWLENRADGSQRARVLFDRKDANGRATEEKIEYLLDGGKLIDRNYTRKIEVTRVILRPGEKMNLLKLGEGPFPLPIGQRREDVLRNFEVTRVAAKPDGPGSSVHVRMDPKSGTSLARRFKAVDVWVGTDDELPRRIETLDSNETTVTTTDLTDLKINGPVTDADFRLPPIDDKWERIEEAFQDSNGGKR
jgi:hypothetical protein